MAPKTVCIIGAGPSGLVAAKTLIHDHPKDTFHVTIFEQSHRIGGLWPISKVDDGMVNPDMCTNQSRHTVSFSDLAWVENTPHFPKAWMVGEYLQRYLETYPGYEVRLQSKVVKTAWENEMWKVWVKEKETEKSYNFDHLIVAAGFFGKPKIPSTFKGLKVPVWHSSKIRDVKDLLTDGGKRTPPPGKNIVVVGGQMSGVETAASIASQLSSAVNSPGESEIKDVEKYFITHVVQKPVWVMPWFFPRGPVVDVPKQAEASENVESKLDGLKLEVEKSKKINRSPTFLPLDLVSYNLGWRPPGKVQNTSGHITPEAAALTHGFMETYIGNVQPELEQFQITDDLRSEPPLLACSDNYNEFVRHKKIYMLQGRVQQCDSGKPDAILIRDGEDNMCCIPNVAAVVCATGFDASQSLDFLPAEILQTLQFEPSDDGFPLALNCHATASRKFPSLGFVGFYRSPYWGVMEMQARLLGKLWSGGEKVAHALKDDTTIDEMMKLRGDPRRAQFPMGDYAYLMESFSEILGIKRFEPAESGADPSARTGIVLPFRYTYASANETERHESSMALSVIDRIFDVSANQAHFVARAVFRGLQGIWDLKRTIDSRIISFPSGALKGWAAFLPRYPTDDESDMEYLYKEEGEFRPSWGGVMHAKRSYIYHYVEKTDKINVWFAKGDYKTADYFFHQIDLLIPKEKEHPDDPWRAESSHLCIEDLYDVTYEFSFRGAVLETWSSTYTVKGPAKDYTIQNVYRRPST